LEAHQGSFEESSLPFLTARGKRERSTPFDICPFCHCEAKDLAKSKDEPPNVSAQKLEKHIGDHIRNFSFFAFLDEEHEKEEDNPESNRMTVQDGDVILDSHLGGWESMDEPDSPDIQYEEDNFTELESEVDWGDELELLQASKNFPRSPEDDKSLTMFFSRTQRDREPADGSPIRILSFDGSLHGLPQLYIVQDIMQQVARLLDENSPGAKDIFPRPCDLFDLICGTSTGGIVALMLGRLRMVSQDVV